MCPKGLSLGCYLTPAPWSLGTPEDEGRSSIRRGSTSSPLHCPKQRNVNSSSDPEFLTWFSGRQCHRWRKLVPAGGLVQTLTWKPHRHGQLGPVAMGPVPGRRHLPTFTAPSVLGVEADLPGRPLQLVSRQTEWSLLFAFVLINAIALAFRPNHSDLDTSKYRLLMCFLHVFLSKKSCACPHYPPPPTMPKKTKQKNTSGSLLLVKIILA